MSKKKATTGNSGKSEPAKKPVKLEAVKKAAASRAGGISFSIGEPKTLETRSVDGLTQGKGRVQPKPKITSVKKPTNPAKPKD